MSDEQDRSHDQRQGPEDPHGPGGADAQPAPRSPLRTDTPEAVVPPIEPVMDPGPGVKRVTAPEEDGEAFQPGADEDVDGGTGQAPERRDVQEENAGTTLDQPSY